MKKQDQAARAQSRKIPSGWGRLWAAFGLGVAAYAIAAILQVFAVTFVEAGKIDMNTALAVTASSETDPK
jgi:hypothetical protein